jgi:hypothetical protein
LWQNSESGSSCVPQVQTSVMIGWPLVRVSLV